MSASPTRPDLPFLTGGGEMAALIAAFDWSATSLGPIETWPGYLRNTIALMLRSPVPLVSLWHEDGYMIYNDAYSGFAGGRHPQLLGSKVREGWPEVADFNDNVMRVGLAGRTLQYQDQELTLYRSGVGEPVWMNLDYSPLLDDAGQPVGVIAIVVETTGKVRAERWLSGERERLRAMFEQAPGFMALLRGPEHVFELANPAYLRLVGHRHVLGLPLARALPEIADQGYAELLDKVFQQAETFTGFGMPVDLYPTPDAAPEHRFVDLVYQPIRDQSGDIDGIFVQGTDVTERVQAEAARRDSEETFRTLAQAVPNHVWAARPDGALYWFNQQVYDYAGAAEGSLDGQNWAQMVHPDDVAGAAERWNASLADRSVYEVQFRLKRHDGTFRWHIARAVPIADANGTIVRWIGTNTDIEDQKRAAEQLERLNSSLEQQVALRTADRDRMWRLSTDLMLVSDFEAKVVALNPAWGQLGWTEPDLVDTSFMALVHPDDRAATLREVGRLSDGATTFRFENRYQARDGSYRTISWTAVPGEEFIHAVGRDVTAERDAAQALRKSELALQQAQKMESIGKLTGGVAHDFNNLLQVVSGNLQLLAKDVAGNARAEKRITNALAGVSRGAKLASQLLAFGRRQPLAPKVVNIGRFIYGMEDMLRRSLGEEIEVEAIVSGGLWNTLIDPNQIENAILNLAINARDAMDGSGKLTIEVGNAFIDDGYAHTHPDVAPGQYVMLAVSDTGCGMTPEIMEQVFEPFFSTKPEGKGTGLGLSMVYGFVKQSGGHVKLYSEVGQGTTAKIYLPRANQAEDVAETVPSTPITGGTETILVAEDDEAVRATVVEMLTELGYRVLKAKDAASGFSVVESGVPIDLLFTDVVMPGPMRSTELARKARERLPGLAVLFTSGYTENSIVHGGRLDAGVELLSKPYTRDALARKLRHVLANQAQRQQAAEHRAAPAVAAAPIVTGLKVLLVEDDILIRTNTAELLVELGHAVSQAGTAQAALAHLDQHQCDVLITDIGLPDMSGTALAREARRRLPGLGIVYATGAQPDAQTAGPGEVFLQKPYSGPDLEAALKALGR